MVVAGEGGRCQGQASEHLGQWHQISAELADPTRGRTPQLAAYFD